MTKLDAVSSTNSNNPTPAQRDVCPICKGAGFVRKDVPPGHPLFGRAIPCTCKRTELLQKRRSTIERFSALGLLKHMTFETFHPDGIGLQPHQRQSLRLAYDICRQYAERPRGWLVLLGNYGCGKTHLAAAIANERLKRGEEVLFFVVPDLLDYLRAAFNPNNEETQDERFEQIRTAPLLILDDLGTHAATPWAQEKLFQIFNYRYNAQLPTVVTTNHALDEIESRIRSRLEDQSLSQIVHIKAPDYRHGRSDEHQDLSTLHLLSHMTFETFDLRAIELKGEDREKLFQAVRIARRFAQNPSGWLVFVGGYGVGKTHLAAAIANEAVAHGHEALFIVVPDLLDHLRATFNPSSPVSYDKRFEQVRRAELLVLDDLGTHSATPWAQEKLFQLFNHRYMARLPTVITMNNVETVDPRLLERMMEMKMVGAGSLIKLDIPPYRGLAKRKPHPPNM
ncbi:hypothetical protein ARMA_1552 [Ardenticatena maritima]|uniref:AAA+ ATPase domain-containing protein n=1 Tax=Ardenticatena maritima TaxID=872965 RepID=A0A0M8K9C4_9CHLR|nr:hypothetical protein ARMA_1552 [Ardenticatena maritima]